MLLPKGQKALGEKIRYWVLMVSLFKSLLLVNVKIRRDC